MKKKCAHTMAVEQKLRIEASFKPEVVKMAKQTKLVNFVLAIALMLTAVATPVQAGTLTIHNKNCVQHKGLDFVKRVTVHVHGQFACKTNKYVAINEGHSKTITLDEYFNASDIGDGTVNECKYFHEAKGTARGEQDVFGTEDSSVTCSKDRVGTCRCTKD